MQIRAGYEISYDCAQPTSMILALSVHPSRLADLLTPDRMRLDPSIPFNTYHDSFGNFCHVIRAPAGRLTMSTDFLMHDDGKPDAIAPQAEQHALEDLPVDVLIYLLGSRYCETDRLSNTAWTFSTRAARSSSILRQHQAMDEPGLVPDARPRQVARRVQPDGARLQHAKGHQHSRRGGIDEGVARQSGWKRCGEQDGQFDCRCGEMIVVPRQ